MIRAFDIHGVVPPIRPGKAGHSPDRAPYPTDMLTFCQRFSGTLERRAILRGLLDLREALRGARIVEGFQWLDGSFAEDVEHLRGRAPKDIDVVTFGVFDPREVQRKRAQQNPELFNQRAIKAKYKVDHYFLPADGQGFTHQAFVRNVSYWYSMWAHQRDTQRWKGFVSVALDADDQAAQAWLDSKDAVHGGAR